MARPETPSTWHARRRATPSWSGGGAYAVDAGRRATKEPSSRERRFTARRTQEKALVTMTGHPLEKIKKDMSRDFYLSAHEAVQYGLIDKVLIPQPKGMGGGGLGLGDGLSSFV